MMSKPGVKSRLAVISILFFVILGLQIYLKTVGDEPAEKTSALKKYYQVPPFTLVNSKGDTVTQERFKGKVWVADFIFTTCGGPCPIMTRNMADLQHSLSDQKVAFMSVTVHPSYDTPKVLADYAEEFGADLSRWEFLTGSFSDIEALAVKGFKLPAGDGKNLASHSPRFALVDKEGFIRGYYDGTSKPEMEKLKGELRVLEGT